MVGCVLSQLKPFEALHSWLWKKARPSASVFPTAKNVELLGLYPIDHSSEFYID